MRLQRPIILLIAALFLLSTLQGQTRRRPRPKRGDGHLFQEWSIDERGDSIPHIFAVPVFVYSKGIDTRKWQKLVVAVKKTYPIAETARLKMEGMEEQLAQMESKREREKFLRQLAKEIEKEYTPVLKKLTRSQGHVLVKLIDRQTAYTPYEILKEFRNGFVAGFWQTVGKLFGQDLKQDYDKEGEDQLLEQVVLYYEAGLL